MSRRGDNIRKRADGRWEGRYQYQIDNDSYKYKSIYGKSYGEVKTRLIQILRTDNGAAGGLQSEKKKLFKKKQRLMMWRRSGFNM